MSAGINFAIFTSPLAKGLFSKWNWTFADEAKLYVNSDIEPLQMGFYELNIASNEGYLQTKYLLIGQTLSGRILSEQECLDILNLPVLEFEQGKSSYGQSEFSTPYFGVGNLDFKINHKQILEILCFSNYILSLK